MCGVCTVLTWGIQRYTQVRGGGQGGLIGMVAQKDNGTMYGTIHGTKNGPRNGTKNGPRNGTKHGSMHGILNY